MTISRSRAPSHHRPSSATPQTLPPRPAARADGPSNAGPSVSGLRGRVLDARRGKHSREAALPRRAPREALQVLRHFDGITPIEAEAEKHKVVKVVGRAHADGEPLIAPVSGRACVHDAARRSSLSRGDRLFTTRAEDKTRYYKVIVEELSNPGATPEKWRPVAEEEKTTDFYLHERRGTTKIAVRGDCGKPRGNDSSTSVEG